MSDPRPMNPPKPNRRKPGANKLEPIDWHEYANDAVLNGNMSTLFHRPPTEDPSAYASPEALVEIEKRTKVGQAGARGRPACQPLSAAHSQCRTRRGRQPHRGHEAHRRAASWDRRSFFVVCHGERQKGQTHS